METHVCWPDPGEAIGARDLMRWVGIIATSKQLPSDQCDVLAVLIGLFEDI